MAARANVRADDLTAAGSDTDLVTDLVTGRTAERPVAPWPTVHAGAPAAAGARPEVVRTYCLPAGDTAGQAAGWYAHLAGLASHLRGPVGALTGEDGWDAEFARALAVLRDPGAPDAGTF